MKIDGGKNEKCQFINNNNKMNIRRKTNKLRCEN